MEMLVNIPESITNIKPISQKDIILALAIQLYIEGEISLAKAASIVGMHRIEFQKILAEKNISFNYDMDMLENDILMAKKYMSDDNSK
jgi:predicted HTH domain antitoxin